MPKKIIITDVPETLIDKAIKEICWTLEYNYINYNFSVHDDNADYRDKIIENLINEVQDLKALVQHLSSRIIEKEGE